MTGIVSEPIHLVIMNLHLCPPKTTCNDSLQTHQQVAFICSPVCSSVHFLSNGIRVRLDTQASRIQRGNSLGIPLTSTYYVPAQGYEHGVPELDMKHRIKSSQCRG